MALRLLAWCLVGSGFVSFVFSTDCPDTWVPFQGSCYMFGHGMTATFVQAEEYCRQHEAHLVHIEEKTENAFLRDYVQRLKVESFWIGLSDETVEGLWQWYDTHKSPNYTDWYPGEPNNSGKNEDCASLYSSHSFHWNDDPCSDKFEPICELSEK